MTVRRSRVGKRGLDSLFGRSLQPGIYHTIQGYMDSKSFTHELVRFCLGNRKYLGVGVSHRLKKGEKWSIDDRNICTSNNDLG